MSNSPEEFVRVELSAEIDRRELFGNLDANLDGIRKATGTEAVERDGALLLRGGDTEKAKKIIDEFCNVIAGGDCLDTQKANYIIQLAAEGTSYQEARVSKDVVCFTTKGRPIKAKTIGQKRYVESIRHKEVVFGIGPAGTGKTYLAVAMAVTAFKNKEVDKIILARPAVEAGERLGFLPGDLQEKVDPYLRPLYDALYDVLGRENTMRLKEREEIEVVPLAYMRGRTLDNAFIILDEAQNTTREQMKMFLTRMGFGSRVVVTGDVTQIDLPKGKKSGLVEAQRVLRNVKEIDFCVLKDADVVRHQLVREIIGAYDRFYQKHPEEREE